MSLIEQKPSGVYTKEVDLSQLVTSASTSVCAQVVVARQGSTKPKFFTSADDYIAEYGNPDAAISFDHYCALDYFKEGSELWAVRVAGEGALTSGVALCWDQGGFQLAPVKSGIADVDNIDWSKLLSSGNQNPIAVFYPTRGPGSYANSLAISISSATVEPFEAGQLKASSSNDGQLPAGTYTYYVSKIGEGNKESLASNPVTMVIASDDQSNSITLTIEPDELAIGYRVYGRTEDNIGLIAELGSADLTFTDTGALLPDLTVQPIIDSSSMKGAAGPFTVKVFDLSYNASTPVETFECTFGEGVDSSGYATELTNRINPFSTYINVASNAITYDLDELPQITSLDPVNMAGGDSGAAPTSYNVAKAWKTFDDKQLYSINILLNSGKANPIVQKAMIELAELRGDCIAMLDMPSSNQKLQQALDYRNLQLNANTSYAAIFTPDLLEADNINGKQLYVPPSGWAAALCARTDRVANASYSIAGLNRGLLNVLNTRYTYKENGEMPQLYKAQINYTKTFIGAGIALWEQQTLQSKYSALSWVSVRRIVNVIKTSLYEYLIYSVQEPNDDFTVRAIVSSCSNYLQSIVDARGIRNFMIDTTTSAVEIDAGFRRVNILIIPMIPIHVIQLNVGIGKSSVSIEETLAQLKAS